MREPRWSVRHTFAHSRLAGKQAPQQAFRIGTPRLVDSGTASGEFTLFLKHAQDLNVSKSAQRAPHRSANRQVPGLNPFTIPFGQSYEGRLAGARRARTSDAASRVDDEIHAVQNRGCAYGTPHKSDAAT